MNVKKIKEIIEARIQPNSWEIRRVRKKSFQRYLIFKDQESQRVVENEKFLVTLYKKYQQDGQEVLGESTLALSAGDDVREKLSAAWEMAGLVANPVFVLPEKGLTYPAVHSLKGGRCSLHSETYLHQAKNIVGMSYATTCPFRCPRYPAPCHGPGDRGDQCLPG